MVVSDELSAQSRFAVLPKDCNRRGAMIVDGVNRTQPDGDFAAVRRMTRPVTLAEPGLGFTIGTESTFVPILQTVLGPYVGALAPIAPPG